jgi:hypothetical protein
MRISLGAHGRVEAPARRIGFALLAILLVTAVAGCGARQTEQARTDSGSPTASASQSQVQSSQSQLESSQQVTASSGNQRETLEQATPFAAAPHPDSPVSPASPAPSAETMHRIALTEDGCIKFEPQWTSVRLGQSIAWHSDLKKPITIYVSPGVFSSLSFVVKPGRTVSTGPALASGRYSFWTEPAACREAPRGVMLSGPGVMVEESFYAAIPGIH